MLLAVGLVLPLAFAANASAQSGALVISPRTARPGQAITVTSVTGDFPPPSAASTLSTVNVRLSTRNGRILDSPAPNGAGNITSTFPVPAGLTPGTYLILATQTNNANDRQRAFTPDRATLQVVAAGRSSSSAATIAVPLGGLVLLGAGFLLVTRRRTTLNRPQFGSR